METLLTLALMFVASVSTQTATTISPNNSSQNFSTQIFTTQTRFNGSSASPEPSTTPTAGSGVPSTYTSLTSITNIQPTQSNQTNTSNPSATTSHSASTSGSSNPTTTNSSTDQHITSISPTTTRTNTSSTGPGSTENIMLSSNTTLNSQNHITIPALTLSTNPDLKPNMGPTISSAEVPGWGVALLVLASVVLLLLLLLLLLTALLMWLLRNQQSNNTFSPYDNLTHRDNIPMYTTHSRFEGNNVSHYEEVDKSTRIQSGSYTITQ